MFVFVGSAPEEGAEETHVSYAYCTYRIYIFIYPWPGHSVIKQEMQTNKRKGRDGKLGQCMSDHHNDFHLAFISHPISQKSWEAAA